MNFWNVRSSVIFSSKNFATRDTFITLLVTGWNRLSQRGLSTLRHTWKYCFSYKGLSQKIAKKINFSYVLLSVEVKRPFVYFSISVTVFDYKIKIVIANIGRVLRFVKLGKIVTFEPPKNTSSKKWIQFFLHVIEQEMLSCFYETQIKFRHLVALF